MLDTKSINDRGELWFDVRPHTEYGTVEIRAPDGQADPDRTMAFVEYTHALVLDLAARYEDGVPGSDLRREVLDENKWRAIRHGHEASFVTRDADGTVELGEIVDRECSRLGVEGIREIYETGSGAQRQRRLHDDEGADALCDSLRLGVVSE
jgi:carboxylate-amine ligase